MIVWVVTEQIDYETFEVTGVFSTEEKAKDFFKDRPSYLFTVDEMEVDYAAPR